MTAATATAGDAEPTLPPDIDRLVRRLIIRWQPERVVLFGSYVRGAAGARSDVDLLVLLATAEQAEELVRRRTQITSGCFPRVDLVISSRDEFEQARGERASFLRSVLEHGQVLHDHRSRLSKAPA